REEEIARLVELLAPIVGVGGMGSMGSMGSQSGNAHTPHTAHTPDTSATSPRLVTLTGPGGTGKTLLALEAAVRLLEPFSGAVWFVPLGDLSDPQLIAGAIADVMRLPRSPASAPLEQVVEALSRQPSLLALDNFEQLVEEGAGVVRTLLERVPRLRCLLTSRHLLGLTGERPFPVPPLPLPAHG